MKQFSLYILMFLSLAIVSCDKEADEDPFFGEIEITDDFIQFDSASANFSIEVAETKTFEFGITSTITTDSPRTINIGIDPSSTLDSDAYTLETQTLVIPAGEFGVRSSITITDVSGEPTETPATLTLVIPESSEYLSEGLKETFTIRSSINGPFSGTFDMVVVEGTFPGFDVPPFTDQTVDIAFTNLSTRTIEVLAYLPAFGTFEGPFTFIINDDNQIEVPRQAPGGGVGCGSAILAESDPADLATIDPDDDSVFQVIYQDNVDNAGGCNEDSYRVVLEFTKQ